MNHHEWSRSRYWLIHFLHNRHDRVTIDWRSSPRSPATPVIRWLARQAGSDQTHRQWVIRRAMAECAADPAFIQALRLFVKEEQYRAKLLAQICHRFEVDPMMRRSIRWLIRAVRHALGLRFELAVTLIQQLLDAAALMLIHDATADSALRKACGQMHHDRQAHIAFVSERLTLEFADFNFIRRNIRRLRLRLMFGVAIACVIVQDYGLLRATDHPSNRPDKRDKWGVEAIATFVRASRTRFHSLLETMVPYRRDVLLAQLLAQQQNPYEKPRSERY